MCGFSWFRRNAWVRELQDPTECVNECIMPYRAFRGAEDFSVCLREPTSTISCVASMANRFRTLHKVVRRQDAPCTSVVSETAI